MFYPELLQISNNPVLLELIKQLDIWFAFLPENERDKITISKLSNKMGIDYDLSEKILDKCVDIGILKIKYSIECPSCGYHMKESTKENLINDIKNISECYSCGEKDFDITLENIEVLYVLIKGPTNSSKELKDYTEKILGNNTVSSPRDTLNNLIKNGKENLNDFFYHPSEDQLNYLKNLFNKLNEKFKNTKLKGDILENLSATLLNFVKFFTVSTDLKTLTNQIDVCIRNTLSFQPSVFSELGGIIYCECKNESKKPIPNNYYHKLASIISSSKSLFEQRVGIIFSINNITKPCKIIAREKFLKENIIIINISKNELEDIIFKNINLLDIIELKINQIKNNTSNLENTNLY